MKKILILVFLICAVVIGWLYIGYYRIIDIENESYIAFFIKKKPTFRIEFKNTEKMWEEQRKAYPNNGLDEMLDYCKYRYALQSKSIDVLQDCRSMDAKVKDFKFYYEFP